MSIAKPGPRSVQGLRAVIGSGDKIRFQIYVRAISQGDELVTVHAVDGRTGQEVTKTSMVRVG